MAQFTPWMQQTVATALRSIIAWKQDNPSASASPPASSSSFTDDGSNFCCNILAFHLTHAKAQVVDVLSTRPVILLISDGDFKVRATLSDDALDTIEGAIGQSIDKDTTGDVFTIAEAVLIATTFGPPNDFIQLQIDRLEYQYHLRKLLPQIRPIEEDAVVYGLITTQLTAIRQQHYAAEENDATVGSANGEASPPSLQPMPSQTMSQIATQVAHQSLPCATGPQFATQIRPQRAGLSLAKDGLEIESGVNLAEPRDASFKNAPHRPVKATQPIAPVDPGLLQLLGRMNTAAGTVDLPPAECDPSPAPKRKADDSSLSFQSASKSSRIGSPSLVPSKRQTPEAGRNVGLSRPGSDLERVQEPSQAKPYPQSREATQQNDHASASTTSRPSQVSNYRHFRHRIPRDQAQLLEQQSSWLPAPSGTSSHLKIPAALMARFEIEIQSRLSQNSIASPVSKQLSSPLSLKANGVQKDIPVESSSDDTSTGLSDDSHDEEGEEGDSDAPYSWEASPRDPSAAADMLPPDSTNESRAAQEIKEDGNLVSLGRSRSVQASSTENSPRMLQIQGSTGPVSNSRFGSQTRHPTSQSPHTPRTKADLRSHEDISAQRVASFNDGHSGQSVAKSGGSYRSQQSQLAYSTDNSPRTPDGVLAVRSHHRTPADRTPNSLQRKPPRPRPRPETHGNSGSWSKEEDFILRRELRKGRNAIEISVDALPNRSPSAIRDRKQMLLREGIANPDSGENVKASGRPSMRLPSSRADGTVGDDGLKRSSSNQAPVKTIQTPPIQSVPSSANRHTGIRPSPSQRSSAAISPPQLLVPASSHMRDLDKPMPHSEETKPAFSPPGTMIKATPTAGSYEKVSTEQSDRPTPSQDPALAHRRARREFFAQGRETKQRPPVHPLAQNVPATAITATPTTLTSPSPFQEFAKAYKDLAINKKRASKQTDAKAKQRLRVLSWDI